MKRVLIAAALVAITGALPLSPANAAGCDGSVQQQRNGRTIQCYYLPTVSNGRVDGLHLSEWLNERDAVMFHSRQ